MLNNAHTTSIVKNIKDILSDQSGAINPGKIADALPHIAELGKQVLQSGYKTFGEWAGRMKEHLGDVWDSVKGHMQNIWDMINNERGAIGKPTETPEFKKWFEGSIVVNKCGEPLTVYHGS